MSTTRLKREARTAELMIRMYCRNRHGTLPPRLCADCTTLWRETQARLSTCPFQEEKPTCGRCPVHCFRPKMRESIKAVMRYAGPRMLFSHPILALWHILDARRRTS